MCDIYTGLHLDRRRVCVCRYTVCIIRHRFYCHSFNSKRQPKATAAVYFVRLEPSTFRCPRSEHIAFDLIKHFSYFIGYRVGSRSKMDLSHLLRRFKMRCAVKRNRISSSLTNEHERLCHCQLNRIGIQKKFYPSIPGRRVWVYQMPRRKKCVYVRIKMSRDSFFLFSSSFIRFNSVLNKFRWIFASYRHVEPYSISLSLFLCVWECVCAKVKRVLLTKLVYR